MSSPRCVIDTNVIISAGISPGGLPLRVLRWVVDHGELLMSAETREELESRFVLRAKFDRYLSVSSRRRFVAQVVRDSVLTPVTSRLAVCADPDDDRFVELAVDGRADCIVTGNTKDFPPSHAGVPVLTPAQFSQTYIGP